MMVGLFGAVLLAGCTRDASKKSETAQSVPAGKITTPQPDLLPSGEALFKQYCSSCHPNGGNVSDPERTLYVSVLKSRHITTPGDVVRIMRHPISRMIRFDASTLSDRDARTIAEYVLKTFK
jgi:cytochrome c6